MPQARGERFAVPADPQLDPPGSPTPRASQPASPLPVAPSHDGATLQPEPVTYRFIDHTHRYALRRQLRMSRGQSIDCWMWSDTLRLRQLLLDHVGRYPICAAELFAAVIADYGDVCLRRLWRALAWQIGHGQIAVVEAGYGRNGQRWTGKYIRAASTPPLHSLDERTRHAAAQEAT